MSTQTLSSSRWQMENSEENVSTATTVAEDDLLLFSTPALNPAYTLVFGVVATQAPLQPKQPVKFIYSQRQSLPGTKFDVPWYESNEDRVGPPGATVISLADWPDMWQHPERLKTACNLAELLSHFDEDDQANWNSFVDSFNFYLQLHNSPRERFQTLIRTWRDETRFISDINEICGHPAYQEIIGMGILALPFIFAELERDPDHWFWALKAITGRDPVSEDQRGNLVLMTKAWLDWANACREKLTEDWTRVFARAAS